MTAGVLTIEKILQVMKSLPPAPPRLFVQVSRWAIRGRSPTISGLHGAGTETVVIHEADLSRVRELTLETGCTLRPVDEDRWEICADVLGAGRSAALR